MASNTLSKSLRSTPETNFSPGDCVNFEDYPEKSDDVEEGFFEIPEVIENVLKFLTSMQDLTNVRLINRIFNMEACRCMRKRCILHINEFQNTNNNSKLKLVDLKKLLSKSRKIYSPIPFHCYDLEVDRFEDESLTHIIQDDRLFPQKIILRRPPHKDNSQFQLNLHELLTRKGVQLQSIHLTMIEDHRGSLALFSSQTPFYVPLLRKLCISGSWENTNHREILDSSSPSASSSSSIRFLIKLINAAPKLKKIVCRCEGERPLIELLDQVNLSKITHFSASSLTPTIFWKLVTTSLPKLTTLHALIDPDLIAEEFVASNVTHEVVEHFSQTIEELLISWNFNSINDNFPECPKLKSLAIKYWSGSLGAFNMEKLPSLKRVQVFDCINELSDGNLKPHPGVETFAFECLKGTGVRFGLYTEQDFNSLLDNVKLQFPHLICLDLNMALTTKAMRSVVKKFPHLVSLILDADSEYDESIFTGISRQNLDEYLAGTKELNDIPRLTSFRDLKRLENLVLSRAYEFRFPKDSTVITDRSVKFGISKIPNLKTLQIDWTKDLSIHTACDHLSHLRNLVVNFSHDFLDNLEPLEILKKYMPTQVVVLKPTKTNYNQFLVTGQSDSPPRSSATTTHRHRRRHMT